MIPINAPPSDTKISGRGVRDHITNPTHKIAADTHRPIPRKQHSHSPPIAITAKTSVFGAGTPMVAPSHPATQWAIVNIHAIPHFITHKPSPPSPSGHRARATRAAGATTIPITGTDSRFATNPYCAIWLKCAAPKGAVAAPATADEMTTAKAPRSGAGSLRSTSGPSRNAPNTATSAVVAAKDS